MKWENIIKKGKRTDRYGRRGRDRRRPVDTPFNPFADKAKEVRESMKERRNKRWGGRPLNHLSRDEDSTSLREANKLREDKRKEAKSQRKFKPKCQNDPCLRIANGTDGIGFCMPCEDDASNRLTDTNSPNTRKNQMEKPTLPNIYR